MDPDPKFRRRKIWGNIWFGFFILYFLNMLVVTVIILLMKPLWYDINEFLIGMIGIRFGWFTLILSLILLVFAHSLYLVIFGAFKLVKHGKTHAGWGHKILPFVFLPVFDFALNLLFSEAGEEIVLVKTQLEYFSPLFWVVLIVILSVTGPVMYQKFVSNLPLLKKKDAKWYVKGKIVGGSVLILVLCIVTIGVPFILVPSTVVNEIPPKPLVIAHRGASHLAPENTLIAAEQAVAFGAAGIEVDLTISYDGVIFLMHDDTLRRTTNVAEIFPERASEDASMFNFSDLRSLDAGSWFVDSDPFNTIKDGYISETTAESYRGELIPSFEEIINFTKLHPGFILDIDSKGPPSGHPYHDNYTETLLTQLLESNLNKSIIVYSFDPLTENMTHGVGALPVNEIISLGGELVNTHHGLTNKQFREYEAAGIEVMCWTVDSVSRFSQLWCLGVDLIKTNNLHLMVPLSKPIWTMKTSYYYVAWVILIILAPTLSFSIDYLVRRKKRQE
jgi:glycerophosphoinositol inositolphosphodiesterase